MIGFLTLSYLALFIWWWTHRRKGVQPEPIDPFYTMTWCDGCKDLHKQGWMTWTGDGLYRCKVCCSPSTDKEDDHDHAE